MKKIFVVALVLIAAFPMAASARPFRTVKLKPGFFAVQFSPDLKRLAAFKTNLEIQFWDLQNGRMQHTFEIGEDSSAVDFSRDLKIMVRAGRNGVRLWDTQNGKLLHELRSSGMGMFSSMVFSPDGKTLAAAGVEDPVCFWDVRSGKLKAERDPLFTKALAFAPNGKSYVTVDYGGMKNGKRDMVVADVETGKILSKLRYSDTISDVSFSPDGKTVLTSGCAGSSDSCGEVHSAQFSDWNVKTGNLQRVIKLKLKSSMDNAYFSQDGKLVIHPHFAKSAFAGVDIWSMKTGLKRVLQWKGNRAREVAIVPNGSEIATASDNTIRFWNLQTGKLMRTLKGHKSDIISLTFSADSKTLASCAKDGTIHFWRV